jgi:hypothetical protein
MLAGAVIGSAVGGLISISINFFINAKSLKEIVHYQCPGALAILIEEKKKNAIKVGIFDEDCEIIDGDIEITSDKGISNRLHEGQLIYL